MILYALKPLSFSTKTKHRYGRQVNKLYRRKQEQSTGSLRQEYVKCGKVYRCRKCRSEELQGPYWYHYYSDEFGRLRSRYIGRTLPPKLAALDDTRKTAERELEALRGHQERIEALERDKDVS